jgi:hypothetical protein
LSLNYNAIVLISLKLQHTKKSHNTSSSMIAKFLLLLALVVVVTTALTFDEAATCSSDSKVRCTGISCGLDIHIAYTKNNTGCDCTEEDMGKRFTDCDSSTDTKSLFFFYKPPATCISSTPLPAPIHDIPCSVRCSAGQSFDVSTKSCVTCQDGHYSQGSAVEVKNWSQKKGLLAQMKTYCETYYWYVHFSFQHVLDSNS